VFSLAPGNSEFSFSIVQQKFLEQAYFDTIQGGQ
jgi:hypothetical protein